MDRPLLYLIIPLSCIIILGYAYYRNVHVYQDELFECINSSEWIISTVDIQRRITPQDNVRELYWTYTMRCQLHEHVTLYHHHDRPTWTQVGDTVRFNLNIK